MGSQPPIRPRRGRARRARAGALGLALLAACADADRTGVVLTFPSSALGAEGELLRRQLTRFEQRHPGITVVPQATPDAADQRHQLFVQWLNARAADPDVLQLDVIWAAEFAAAGWILPLDRFGPDADAFFSSAVTANRWDGRLYALPWFADVGMLYWRTDLLDHAPATWGELLAQARQAMRQAGVPYGLVLQGARYEGLVTVFLEALGATGGAILDETGRVRVDDAAAVRALDILLQGMYEDEVIPPAVLAWQEEQSRFAFQAGQAVFMRNWPYAYSLMQDSTRSTVAGRFAVTTMPGAPGGAPAAALGGSQLAINANSEHPEAAYTLISYLTAPEQMLERASTLGQFPTRSALYDDPALGDALPVPSAQIQMIIRHAVPRPVTPVYTELSQILQVHLHRALSRQERPEVALQRAAQEMRALLRRVGLTDAGPP